MKRRNLICLLACASLLLVGCGGQGSGQSAGQNSGTTKNTQEQSTVEETEENTEESQEYDPKTEYVSLYSPVLNELYQVAIGNREETYFDIAGGIGVYETVQYNNAGYENPLDSVGYAYEDISGDDIPELLIIANEQTNEDGDSYGGNRVLACYTLQEGEEDPILSFEGWGRNNYYYGGDAVFYHWASNGAADNLEGLYHITEDGTTLEADRIYFTGLSSDNETVLYYTNTSGEWDPRVSEQLDITDEEYEELVDEWRYLYEPIFIITFSALADTRELVETGEDVPEDLISVSFALEGDVDSESSMRYVYGEDTGYQVDLLITTSETLSEFAFMTLSMIDFDEDYHVIYEANTKYASDYFVSEMPFVVSLTFNGDTPEYAISFKDADENYHAYAIDLSGEDGQPYFISLGQY